MPMAVFAETLRHTPDGYRRHQDEEQQDQR
jgi:hypothetical protein